MRLGNAEGLEDIGTAALSFKRKIERSRYGNEETNPAGERIE